MSNVLGVVALWAAQALIRRDAYSAALRARLGHRITCARSDNPVPCREALPSLRWAAGGDTIPASAV
jgi:hypothetical protein